MSALSAQRAKLGMAMLTAFVQVTCAVAAPSAHPAIGTDAASVLRNQIVAAFGRGRDPHLSTTPRPAVDVSKLVNDRVDRRLEAGAIAVTGRDVNFTAPDGDKRTIGLLTLRYPNAVIATQPPSPSWPPPPRDCGADRTGRSTPVVYAIGSISAVRATPVTGAQQIRTRVLGMPFPSAPMARVGTLAALVAADGSAGEAFVRRLAAPGALTRDLADAVHSVCVLHGRHPGVIDHALARTACPADWLVEAAHAFAEERAYLARLTSAAGPLPSTPGQAESAAAVAGQRHAFDMLVGSDRAGCALGAAAALVLDWRAIRGVLDAAARRFGVTEAACALPGAAAILADAPASVAIERAQGFAAQQVLAQHRGLWQLLESRAVAREHA